MKNKIIVIERVQNNLFKKKFKSTKIIEKPFFQTAVSYVILYYFQHSLLARNSNAFPYGTKLLRSIKYCSDLSSK